MNRTLYGMGALAVLGAMYYGGRSFMDAEEKHSTPKRVKPFEPTLEAEQARIKKAEEKRARKAAKLREMSK